MRAKKRLGQHFLHDPAVIRRLIETIRPQPDDDIVEIGGGPGALTIPLCAKLNPSWPRLWLWVNKLPQTIRLLSSGKARWNKSGHN